MLTRSSVVQALARCLGFTAAIALLVLAFPPRTFGWLVLVAIVPLLLAVHQTRLSIGLFAGLFAMLGMGVIYEFGWFWPPILDTPLPRAALAACGTFGIALALPIAIAATGTWTLKRACCVVAAGVCGEGMLLLLLPGHLALALSREPIALGVASLGGIWAVSLLIWWVNVSVAAWLATRQHRFAIAALAVVPVALAAWGASANRTSPETIRVAAIQESRAQNLHDWRQLHLAASEPIDGARPDMVVWPELSATAVARSGRTARLVDLARTPGAAPFIAGFLDDARPLSHNTAAVFSSAGESARYFKRHPFAEERGNHAPGDTPLTVELAGVRYGLSICFDSCFPATMRATAREPVPGGALPQIILLPNLDPPDHTGFIQAVHAAFTPFRAAEIGLPIVRADTTSRSMIVGPTGRVLAEAGEGTAETIHATVPLGIGRPTFAMRVGDGVLYGCAMVLLAGFTLSLRERLRGRNASSANDTQG